MTRFARAWIVWCAAALSISLWIGGCLSQPPPQNSTGVGGRGGSNTGNGGMIGGGHVVGPSGATITQAGVTIAICASWPSATPIWARR